jgi:methionyl-tRNA formyltransferase
MLKIGYFADGPWSYEAFKRLIADKEVEFGFICVRFDTQDETLKGYCSEYGIPYLKHKNVNVPEFIDKLSKYNCDLLVSLSFNQIFRRDIIDKFPLKAINCHAGKLPFYRGRNILNWALINDEKEFGITVHYIDEGIDTGDIILQQTLPITDDDTYATLLEKAYTECADLLYSAVRKFIDGNVMRIPQSEIHPVGFYCTQRKVGDEWINWNQTSRELFNFIRAICLPGPQARASINGMEMKIEKARLIKQSPSYKCTVGAVLCKLGDRLLVKTADSCIELIEYEYEGCVKTGDRFEV